MTLGGIISKILGAVYRIPLTNLLGTFAMGLYQLVFPLYGLLVMAGMGFSVAVSKAVAKERQLNQCAQCKEILSCALLLSGAVGLVLSAILYLFAYPIAHLQGNALIGEAYRILAPSVLVVCLSGALRGYFQGQMKMFPSAVSQIAEQLFKLVLGLIFAYRALPDEIQAVNGAILAVTLSEIVALAVFVLYYFVERAPRVELGQNPLYCKTSNGNLTPKRITSQLLKTALPVLFGGILAPLSQLIDSSLMLKFLSGDATRLYGVWSGPVHSLFTMPVMLSIGISSAILPSVSGKVAIGNMQEVDKKINLALKLNTVIVLPCVIGFIFFSVPIIKLLYGSLSMEDILLSAKLLSVVGVGSLFMCYAGTLSSVLQGVGKEYYSLLFTALAMVAKTAINVIFLPSDKVGVFAIAFSTILCYFVSVALSVGFLQRKIGIKFDFWSVFGKPLIAGTFLAIPLFLSNLLAKNFIDSRIGSLAVIGISGVIYIMAVVGLKIFDGLLHALKLKLHNRGKNKCKTL